MAMADLGTMELWRLGLLEGSFSPLIERRMALTEKNESAIPTPSNMIQEGPQCDKAHGGMTYLHGLLAVAGTMVVVTGVVVRSCWALLRWGVGDGDGKTVEEEESCA